MKHSPTIPQIKKILSGLNLNNYIVAYKKKLHPFPVCLVVPAYYLFFKKFFKFNLANCIILNDDGMWSGHIDEKNFEQGRKLFFSAYRKDKNIIDAFTSEFKRVSKPFLDFTSALVKIDYSNISDKELLALYLKYNLDYIDSFIYSECPAETLKDTLDITLKESLLKHVKDEKELNSIFSILVIPADKNNESFITREERELLKIALIAKDNVKSKNTENKKATDSPFVSSMLKTHHENYLWLPVDYNGEAWKIEEIKKRLGEMINENPEKRIKEIDQNYKNISAQQQAIKKKYKIDAQTWNDCIAAQKCMILMDLKKEVYTKSHYHIQFVMKEIARRLNLSLMHVDYMAQDEIEDALTDVKSQKKYTAALLNGRYKKSAYINIGNRFYYLDDAAEQKVRSHLEKTPDSETELKGITGNPGIVKGRARVIHETSEFGSMKKGEILVTSFTTPEYVVVMKKAAGIVTDMGSVTSHSSIVARELNIPCVVGTKFATTLIKDGDLLEVDANNGIVRIEKKFKTGYII